MDVYKKQIRSILEYAVPVWHPGLSKKDSKILESVQKCALGIMLGQDYISYKESFLKTGIPRLDIRRDKMCLEFPLKSLENPIYSSWFVKNQVQSKRSSNGRKYLDVQTRTNRYKKSPLPYMTQLLNSYETP